MSKIVEVSGAERRRDKRRPSFIKASLNGQPITILDVSLGGLGGTIELHHETGDLPAPGDLATIELEPDSDKAILLTVEVIRADRELGLFGAHIVEMGDSQFRALERLTLGRPL